MTFEEVMHEFSSSSGLEAVPQDGLCRIRLEDGLIVAIELGEYDIVSVTVPLGNIAPGKGRENLFRIALIYNGSPTPLLHGHFGYSKQADTFLLSEQIALEGLTGQILLDLVLALIHKGREWINYIKNGTLPPPPKKNP